ncbi:MAG: nucleotide exchange factor GrpE [Prevotellaceae bacterium]|jgi:molecular chaperone GrpE|nr:nucleotide exchange factor GrpE [Prevotellaceae bacterium]
MSEKEKHECGCNEEETCKNGTCDCSADENTAGSESAAPAELTVEEKLAESQDKYLRLVAEFDNYRKRTARERLDLITTAGEETIKGLLNVLDDFERAEKAAETTQDVQSLREGTKLIHQKLVDYLASKGLKPIEAAAGSDFDTDLHDAVTKFPAPDEAHKNKIIDTVQQGYKLHEKVIRYAKVVVGE